MAQIRVLSQNVADQIAAGEVAERPSAVVKELVENALDAGADKIDVEIKKGGIELIYVSDNGCGIEKNQVETAFLRHATSKLSAIEDLETVSTMGFRGEALASICAVAKVEVITKPKEAQEGAYLLMEHGKVQKKDEISCPDGTVMMVKELFANVPARMKFLKKDATEAGYVADVVSRIALANPHVAFSYTQDGKEVFQTSGDGNLTHVILQIYGLDHARAVLPVDFTQEGISVTGVVGKAELSRGNRTRQTLFVNGRYIKNHVVGKVVEEAFRNNLMVGRFPFFVLNIALPYALVDVNVHPAKTEVKFANEKQVYDVVYHAVKNGLMPKEEPKKEVASASATPSTSKGDAPYQRTAVNPQAVRAYLDATMPLVKAEPLVVREAPVVSPYGNEQTEIHNILEETPAFSQQEMMAEVAQTAEPKNDRHVLGQVLNTYIVCRSKQGLLLIDQHAAHERLRFDELKAAYGKREKMCQMLLMPYLLNLDHGEKEAVLQHKTMFQDLGFDLEDFGGNTLVVNGAPIAGSEAEIRDLILELLEAMEDRRSHPVADFEEKMLDMIACKGAIKAHDRMSMTEMEDLAKKVWEMEEKGSATCPHGRPICVCVDKVELEKLFKRRI